ncbi:putative membrane protein [Piscirickettsia salmonis LF-89 = ATCC VR-1361]|nr:putative membrane protein [Piscirickettsia salmonis LF-89 = ATCC VR-1361]
MCWTVCLICLGVGIFPCALLACSEILERLTLFKYYYFMIRNHG